MQRIYKQNYQQTGKVSLSILLLLLALFVTGLFSGIIIFHTFLSPPALNRAATSSPMGKNASQPGSTRSNPFSPLAAATLAEKNHAAIVVLQQRVQQLNRQIHGLKKNHLADRKKITQKTTKLSHQSSTSTPPPNNYPMYTLDRLIQGGVNVTIANDIIRKQSETELKRLDLQDRAKREGYYMTKRYKDELAKINAQAVSLRSSLGDSDYDRFLYKSHLNNRVKVISVMPGSAAEQSGIQKNDIILDYDNKRVFSWNELKTATTQGSRDEQVPIDVLRNGELFSLVIPRGPLGIRLSATRVAPQQ